MRQRSACLLAAVLWLAQAQAIGQPAAPPSEAERLLFQHDHFAASRHPQSLHYRYVQEAEGQARLTDQAVLTLANGGGGRCCDAHADYLSGALAVQLPDVADAQGNPLLLHFLEGEVRLLQRTTNGQAVHFRRRIRQSLADEATVTEGSIRWGGATVPARTVHVAPFLNDPFRPRFAEQARTEYAFVLSDAVPGGVYQASATLAAPAGGAAPLARRTLTIEETKP